VCDDRRTDFDGWSKLKIDTDPTDQSNEGSETRYQLPSPNAKLFDNFEVTLLFLLILALPVVAPPPNRYWYLAFHGPLLKKGQHPGARALPLTLGTPNRVPRYLRTGARPGAIEWRFS